MVHIRVDGSWRETGEGKGWVLLGRGASRLRIHKGVQEGHGERILGTATAPPAARPMRGPLLFVGRCSLAGDGGRVNGLEGRATPGSALAWVLLAAHTRGGNHLHLKYWHAQCWSYSLIGIHYNVVVTE